VLKYNKLMLAAILMSLAAVVWAANEQEIDINAITQTNPFAQFTQKQNAPAATTVAVEKPELFVETATLKFFDAKSVKASISNMSGDFGNMEPDTKGNTLIICDTKENVQKILEQIRKIDRKPEQIMIEVVIVDVKLTNETEIGVNWDVLTAKYNTQLDNHSEIGTSFRQSLGFTPRASSVSGVDPLTVANGTAWNTVGPGSDFSILYGDIRNVIHALQEKNNVEILASPRVMVVSGKKSVIKAVTDIPYLIQSQSNGVTTTSSDYKNDVGITLNVGATLTDDKFIILDVNTEQSTYINSNINGGAPIIDKRNIASSLLLRDGQVLVIGGLRQKETHKQTNQLPFLGDLPIVGLAFKSTDTIKNNSELLILLSPHIYNKDDKLTNDQMQKYNEITQKPLLTIPDTDENKEKAKKAEAEKAKKAKEAKKLKK